MANLPRDTASRDALETLGVTVDRVYVDYGLTGRAIQRYEAASSVALEPVAV